MKTKITLLQALLGAALSLGGGTSVSAAEDAIPTVRVAASESKLNTWDPSLGSGLGEIMITELARLTNVRVLESLQLGALRQEIKLGQDGEVAKEEAVEKGNWAGADFTFYSTFTRFGGSESKVGGNSYGLPGLRLPGGGSFSINSKKSEVQIDWRIIDNTTGGILKAGRAEGVQEGTSVSVWRYGGGGTFGANEFRESALGKATMLAIAKITGDLAAWTPPARTGRSVAKEKAEAKKQALAKEAKDKVRNVKGEVELVEDGKIWISLGAEKGFSKGDRVKVYKGIEKKNKAGKVVAIEYQLAGEVELSVVKKGNSCADLKDLKAEEGWVVAAADLDINQLD